MPAKEDNRSFRIVCEPGLMESAARLLEAEGYQFQPEPFSPFCKKLISSPAPLGASLAAFFGYIYIQNRSSMLPPLALSPAPGSIALDMCASPGGKTGFLAQLLGEDGFVLGNEPNFSRYATLRANLARLNLFNTGICSYGGENIPLHKATCPYILLDPPCSGWGTVDKNPATVKIWKAGRIQPLLDIQKKLLAKAVSLLKTGGRLLYSTCTTNSEENEDQIRCALANNPLRLVSLMAFPGFAFDRVLCNEGMLKVEREKNGSQGFFLALLEKTGEHPQNISPADLTPDPEKNGCRRKAIEIPLPGHGRAEVFDSSVRFVQEKAAEWLDGFSWEAPLLGKLLKNGSFQPLGRLRYNSIMTSLPKIICNDLKKIRNLLNGQNFPSPISDDMASLWWEDLPLGIVRIKKGRVISAFRQN